jgi:hypothetical protein
VSEDHVANLNNARAQLVEQRRAIGVELARPYEHGTAEQTREQFIAVQAAIDIVDRALQDEKTAASKGQYSRESR